MPSDFVLKLWVFTSSQPVELSIVINFKFPLFWVAQHVAKQKGAVQIAFEGEKHQVVDFPRGGGGGDHHVRRIEVADSIEVLKELDWFSETRFWV